MTKERLMELGKVTEENAVLILQELEKEKTESSQLTDSEREELQQEYDEKLKLIAIRFAIRMAGGKNEKAILALVDMDNVQIREDGSLVGLDLDKVRLEAPYLFEKVEKKIQGTGFRSGVSKDKKEETAKRFKDALLRR
jgi:hypothetical protein